MLMTLLSMLGGGLMRLLPEVVALFNKRTDYGHELAMLDKQVQLENVRAANNLRQTEVQGDINQALAVLQAQQSALTGQMQKVGVAWVDALNFLVRPLVTYYFLAFYGLVKAATVVVALRALDPWTAIIQCWGADDRAVLSGILAFWFVGRVFDKKQ
jgi:hypothetical protein